MNRRGGGVALVALGLALIVLSFFLRTPNPCSGFFGPPCVITYSWNATSLAVLGVGVVSLVLGGVLAVYHYDKKRK